VGGKDGLPGDACQVGDDPGTGFVVACQRSPNDEVRVQCYLSYMQMWPYVHNVCTNFCEIL
jgi:hypothetical protein